MFALYVECLPPSLNHGLDSLFTTSDARTTLGDMSSALEYLSIHGIVHNDKKPANITYSPERGAVLIDFGIATRDGDRRSNGGTPWYLPPEFVYKIPTRPTTYPEPHEVSKSRFASPPPDPAYASSVHLNWTPFTPVCLHLVRLHRPEGVKHKSDSA